MISLDRRSLVIGAPFVIAGLGARAQAEPVVETAAGRVRGASRDGVATFVGIPYAAPPVGELRYRGPRPVAPWPGVRAAIDPGAASIQTLGGAAAWLYEGADPQSEDCLFLNVWTPDTGGNRPVMVWLHGGAWRTGHGLVAGTNGAALAARGDVVVVTLNYRLGALGWLGHPDLRDEETGAFANWGHLDQMAALRWVRDSIARFGGDPTRVTVFGQSAGGQSTATLAQNPASQDLFHQAIIESGSLHGFPAFPDVPTAAAYAETLAKRLETTVPGLRMVPAQRLHEEELRLARETTAGGFGRAAVLPVLDGIVLQTAPRDGALPAMPLLIGTTRTEGSFWFDLVNPDGSRVPGLKAPDSEEALVAMLRTLAALYRPEAAETAFPRLAEAYRDAAGAAGEASDPKSLWIAAYTDAVFRLRAHEAATRHAAAGHPAYVYEFQQPLLAPARGTPHTAEIPFVFGTYAHPFFRDKVGAGAAEAALSRSMLSAWASFAHHGRPDAAEGSAPWVARSGGGEGINLLGGPALHRRGTWIDAARTQAWSA